MDDFKKYWRDNIKSGRIGEIIDKAEIFFGKKAGDVSPEITADILCEVMLMTRDDLDRVIAEHSEVVRTIKGHAFEAVFDAMMAVNDVECVEAGGDTDVDRSVNGKDLQLKTPYIKGCKAGIVSYKTHKTHGAKSQMESEDYYHKIEDFADFLVGLVSYEPFEVLIVPKGSLPTVPKYPGRIQSPMYLRIDDPETNNNFKQLGVTKNMKFPSEVTAPGNNECLPLSGKLLKLKSEFILKAVFNRKNFRIWDMNLRGFIREHMLLERLKAEKTAVYPPSETGLKRSDKCDFVLKTLTCKNSRFQIKGLTWSKTRFAGADTAVDCESQLSRGRINDHPTQSRLYRDDDFEYLIIAVDPPYSNTLSLEVFGKKDYAWKFYCVPMFELEKHKVYTDRVAPHQIIPYKSMQKYLIGEDWFDRWKRT